MAVGAGHLRTAEPHDLMEFEVQRWPQHSASFLLCLHFNAGHFDLSDGTWESLNLDVR